MENSGIDFGDLVHTFKGLVHSRAGRRKQALSEFRKIKDPINLPVDEEWDAIDVVTKVEIYTEGWRQLREEGYDYSRETADLLDDN